MGRHTRFSITFLAIVSTQSFKLAVPGVDRLIPRPRQLAGLTNACGAAALVWLMGLPGAGKTALGAQWVRQADPRRARSVWYRLDEDDADVAGVFDALRRHPALAAAGALPAWSPENQPELQAFARAFFSRLPACAPLTLVFDDCHRVADDAAFFEMLDVAREVCGPGVQLLAISRRRPPMRIDRGAVAGWLEIVDDLHLTLDEAAEVACRVSGRPWTASEIEMLRGAGGWMAHVLALARGVDGSGTRKVGDITERVGEFLAAELLLMLPPTERRAFRLLAELPELPRALAEEGHVSPRCARFLQELSSTGYFVEATAAGAWRMHDLLRDALRGQNAVCEGLPELAQERRTLAAAAAEHVPSAAMNLLVVAGDGPGALALLRRHGREWLAQGRHRQVAGWLAALPPAPPTADPRTVAELTLWRAEALLPLEPEASRPLFARCRAVLVPAGIGDLAYRAWCGEVSSYVVQWGAVQGLAELVDQLPSMQAALGTPPAEWRFRTAADALTALMYGRAEDPRMHRFAAETARAVEQAPDNGSRVMAAAQLLIYRAWWTGDYPGARALYDAFDAQVETDAGLAPLPRLLWLSNAAIIDWTCGDPARCYDKVDRGLALADASGVHVRDFFLLTQGIFCALSQEDLPRAQAYLERLAVTARGPARLDVMVHHFFRGWYCLMCGDAPTALAHAEAAQVAAEAIGSLFHKVIVLSILGPARLHTGDVDGARRAYRAQIALAKSSDNLPFTYIAFCCGAEIAQATGDEEELRKQLHRILTVKQLGGFHTDCGWRSSVRGPWMAFALEHRILPDVARQWIREKRLVRPAGYDGEWPMPVRIAALGGLVVEVGPDGSPPAGGKPAAKLREFLAMLVAARDGLVQTDLCDWLWPNADGDRATASLKAIVHRLRTWLGREAVTVRDGIVSLDPRYVQCDLWDWMDGGQEARPLAAPALVLSGCTSPPVLALRERLAETLALDER